MTKPTKFLNHYRIPTTRLPGWDYGDAGYYFVTICTKHKYPYFGSVVQGNMELNQIGKIAHQCWQDTPNHNVNVDLDTFIIMPNHLHGIIIIAQSHVKTRHGASLPQPDSFNQFGPQRRNLASIIGGFKSSVTRTARKNSLVFNWQSRFHDHIIRNEKSLKAIREYVVNNPKYWDQDPDHV